MDNNPFQTFFWGGFEPTDHLNCFGERVDYLRATGHLKRLETDYVGLTSLGIKTVREGIQWSQVERQPYCYDWSNVRRMLNGAHARGIQQVWDLCHFGYPDDLTPLHPYFTTRFVNLCREFVRFYRRERAEGTIMVTPIVEASFISWLGGEVNGTVPFTEGQGWRTKYLLMKAYIAGVAAMKELDDDILIVTSEPLSYAVPRVEDLSNDEVWAQATLHNHHQYQALDMLTGRLCPELGGRPEYLDIVGLNYYENSQFEWGGPPLSWVEHDGRRQPLAVLVQQAHQRYGKPVVLTETGHWGAGELRARWVDEVAEAAATLLNWNVPLLGVCLYPVLDRINWDRLWEQCHQPGIWDTTDPHNADSPRELCESVAAALERAQHGLLGPLMDYEERLHPNPYAEEVAS